MGPCLQPGCSPVARVDGTFRSIASSSPTWSEIWPASRSKRTKPPTTPSSSLARSQHLALLLTALCGLLLGLSLALHDFQCESHVRLKCQGRSCPSCRSSAAQKDLLMLAVHVSVRSMCRKPKVDVAVTFAVTVQNSKHVLAPWRRVTRNQGLVKRFVAPLGISSGSSPPD